MKLIGSELVQNNVVRIAFTYSPDCTVLRKCVIEVNRTSQAKSSQQIAPQKSSRIHHQDGDDRIRIQSKNIALIATPALLYGSGGVTCTHESERVCSVSE